LNVKKKEIEWIAIHVQEFVQYILYFSLLCLI